MAHFTSSYCAAVPPAPADDVADLSQQSDGSWIANHDGLILKTAFQPIFAQNKGQLRPVACEGLLRASMSDTKVSPGAYFGSLESHEQDFAEATARTLHIRNAAKLPLAFRRLFLNFDPSLFAAPHLFIATLKQIARELRDAKIPASHVICEITEQAVKDTAALKDIVQAFRTRGYLVAVDDYGAQSSNAARVAQLEPDIVKIDGHLVQQMMQSPERYTELCRLVESFRDQGIYVVLEGLEKAIHVPLAINTSADMFQGFALALPQLAPIRTADVFTPALAQAS